MLVYNLIALRDTQYNPYYQVTRINPHKSFTAMEFITLFFYKKRLIRTVRLRLAKKIRTCLNIQKIGKIYHVLFYFSEG
jgi:hypothetical protein